MKGIVDEVLERTTGKETPPGKPSSHNLFAYAPVAVCVVGLPFESSTDKALREKDPERFKARRFQVNPGLQGISAGIAQFLLAAHALGYGTCWMTGPLIAKAELESTLCAPPSRGAGRDHRPREGGNPPRRSLRGRPGGDRHFQVGGIFSKRSRRMLRPSVSSTVIRYPWARKVTLPLGDVLQAVEGEPPRRLVHGAHGNVDPVFVPELPHRH
jgi:hypothetical protein